MGRWIDFENDYKTMNLQYMESVWWVFKQLYDKGLVYRSFKVGFFFFFSKKTLLLLLGNVYVFISQRLRSCRTRRPATRRSRTLRRT
jgi:hypothetical protein